LESAYGQFGYIDENQLYVYVGALRTPGFLLDGQAQSNSEYTELRHYTTNKAAESIQSKETIKLGQSGKIWLTPDQYNSGVDALNRLALTYTPNGFFRIPISRIARMSNAATVDPIPAGEGYDARPGGGTEITTIDPIDVSGVPFEPFVE